MVVGVGIDAVQISSMRRLLETGGDAFETATFSGEERRAAHVQSDAAARFAGLFAVKEAVYKALAPRAGKEDFDLRKVRVEHWADGSPHVVMDGYLSSIMERTGACSVLVSVTNEGDFAMAIALAQTEPLA